MEVMGEAPEAMGEVLEVMEEAPEVATNMAEEELEMDPTILVSSESKN